MSRSFPVAFYDGQDKPDAACVELTWSELVETLAPPFRTACAAPGVESSQPSCIGKKCPAKDGEAWSPVELIEPRRSNDNVKALTAAVFDLDHLKPGDLDRVRASLTDDEDAYTYVIHSTHGHAPPH